MVEACRNGFSDKENQDLSLLTDPSELTDTILDQIGRLPLRKRLPESGRPFRILCLDGGGIRGAYTASVLSSWEEHTAYNIRDHFDLIAGTSTGGILAIGLGMGLKASDLLDFYEIHGGVIFPTEKPVSKLRHSIQHWFGSKFNQNTLKEKIEEVLTLSPVDTTSLNNSMTRLVIPSYDTESDTLLLYRTSHGEFEKNNGTLETIDVALATSAAPTYFDPIRIDNALAVDGGVWANSPTTVALAEAVNVLGVDMERIEMLSVGTTYSPELLGNPLEIDQNFIETILEATIGKLLAKIVSKFWKPKSVKGKIGWAPKIAGFLMKTQAQTADLICRNLLGDRFLRIDTPTTKTELDDVDAIKRLIRLGEESASKNIRDVQTKFLNGLPVDHWK